MLFKKLLKKPASCCITVLDDCIRFAAFSSNIATGESKMVDASKLAGNHNVELMDKLKKTIIMLKAKYKIKEVDIVLETGIRLSNTFTLEVSGEKDNIIKAALTNEAAKHLKGTEDIKEYSVDYVRAEVQSGNFIVSVCRADIINSIYETCASCGVIVDTIRTPENAMLNYIKSAPGCNAILLNSGGNLRIVVSDNGAVAYSRYIQKSNYDSVETELESILSQLMIFDLKVGLCFTDCDYLPSTVDGTSINPLAMPNGIPSEFFACLYNTKGGVLT